MVKGLYKGFCNRTACQLPNSAIYFNHSTRKYYCRHCADEINSCNRIEAMLQFGHDLCTLGENK